MFIMSNLFGALVTISTNLKPVILECLLTIGVDVRVEEDDVEWVPGLSIQ